jgi:hypothetical protein
MDCGDCEWWDDFKKANENIVEDEYCSPSFSCNKLLRDEAIKLLKEYDDALRLMVYQYCTVEKGQFMNGWPEKEVFFNRHMCAGENAFKVLGIENMQEVPEDWV